MNNATTNETNETETLAADESKLHPWEKAGLGLPPFRFVGMRTVTYQACHGAPIQPGGSCDYCGQAIYDQYQIRSADGKVFKVGCDCVSKVHSAKNVDPATRTLLTAVDRARRAAARAKRAALDVSKADDLAAILADATSRARLAALPHPTDWRAAQGATGLDWAEWMLGACGAAGRARLLKAIKSLIA